MAASKQASKQASIHMHVRNVVTLVWGSLRLAPIKVVHTGSLRFSSSHAWAVYRNRLGKVVPIAIP